MAITLLQLTYSLNKISKELQTNSNGTIMIQLASDALAMVTKRVQQTGQDSDGRSFSPYSTKPMLAGRQGMTVSAFNKIAGSKKKRKELQWVTIGGSGFSFYAAQSAGGQGNSGGKRLFVIPGGYKQFRELHGRQTGFVDFTFTGRMWNNIKLVSSHSELVSGVAVIKATEPIQQKKLEGNTKRRGPILALSNSEADELQSTYVAWIDEVFHKNNID